LCLRIGIDPEDQNGPGTPSLEMLEFARLLMALRRPLSDVEGQRLRVRDTFGELSIRIGLTFSRDSCGKSVIKCTVTRPIKVGGVFPLDGARFLGCQFVNWPVN